MLRCHILLLYIYFLNIHILSKYTPRDRGTHRRQLLETHDVIFIFFGKLRAEPRQTPHDEETRLHLYAVILKNNNMYHATNRNKPHKGTNSFYTSQLALFITSFWQPIFSI